MFHSKLLSLRENSVVAFLDIGCLYVRVCIAQFYNRFGNFKVLFLGKKPINPRADIVEVRNAILAFIAEIEDDIDIYIKHFALCINGDHTNSITANIAMNVSGRGNVGTAHLRKLIAKIVENHANRYPKDSILDVLFDQYFIDNRFYDKNPIGISADEISVNANIISIPSAILQNLTSVLDENISLIVDCEPVSLCAAEACFGFSNSNNKSTLFINIGASSTEFCIYKDGYASLIKHFPIAGDAITQAIATKFCMSFANAEKVKIIFGDVVNDAINATHSKYEDDILSSIKSNMGSFFDQLSENDLRLLEQPSTNGTFGATRKGEKLLIELDKTYSIPRRALAALFGEIFSALFTSIKNIIESSTTKGMEDISSIYITGGVAATSGIDKIATKIFKKDASIGSISNEILQNAIDGHNIHQLDDFYSFFALIGAPLRLCSKYKSYNQLFYGNNLSSIAGRILSLADTFI